MNAKTNDGYLTGPATAARYSITTMTLWRWSCNKALGFPVPLIVNRRRLFRISELEEWEQNRERGSVPAPAMKRRRAPMFSHARAAWRMDIATLGIAVDSRQAVAATAALNHLTPAARRAEAATDRTGAGK